MKSMLAAAEKEAIAAGATEIRITGNMAQDEFFKQRFAAKFGYTLRKVNEITVEWIKAL